MIFMTCTISYMYVVYDIIDLHNFERPFVFLGSFEVALLRLTRALDESNDSVAFGRFFVSVDLFQALSKLFHVFN